jgi:cation transport ATPase
LNDFDNPPPRSYRHTETDKALTYSSLALAAAADFAFPILLPASGVVLIFTNLGNLRAAWQEIKSRQVGLSVLYITIAGATLASGSFFTAALMGWFIQFWDRRSHRELSAAQRQLLAEFRRRPRFAWLCCDGAELEVPVEQLKKGDTVIVRAGEMIPADGVVIEGHAELDERLVCHTEGLSLKTVNDKVFANSLLFEGDLKIRVQRSSETSRAATIVRAMEVASTPTPAHLKRRGERFAKRTVAPTLAAAGLGLAVGDLSTALAILRPDYWSGPGMSEPLGKLHDVVECARHGVVVRNPTALERLSQSNLLLIDLHCVLQGFQHSRGVNGNGNCYADGSRPVLNEMREGIEQLRRTGELSVGIISEGSASHVSRCASFLGADFFESGLSDSAKAEMVADRGARGQKVAFVGDCRQHLEAARQAHVAISINDIEGFDEDPADVFLLNSQLSNLSRFWHVSSLERRRRRVHHGYILLPNMVCVAGALFLGFTSLHSVLITNAGVYIVYRSGKKWLRRLQHRSGGSTTIEINNTQAKAGPIL